MERYLLIAVLCLSGCSTTPEPTPVPRVKKAPTAKLTVPPPPQKTLPALAQLAPWHAQQCGYKKAKQASDEKPQSYLYQAEIKAFFLRFCKLKATHPTQLLRQLSALEQSYAWQEPSLHYWWLLKQQLKQQQQHLQQLKQQKQHQQGLKKQMQKVLQALTATEQQLLQRDNQQEQ